MRKLLSLLKCLILYVFYRIEMRKLTTIEKNQFLNVLTLISNSHLFRQSLYCCKSWTLDITFTQIFFILFKVNFASLLYYGETTESFRENNSYFHFKRTLLNRELSIETTSISPFNVMPCTKSGYL